MSVPGAAQSDVQVPAWLEGEALKDKIKKLPLPIQVLINGAFALLLAIDLAIVDFLPFFDELLLGWLLWTGASATVSAIKERREGGRLEDSSSRVVDVRDQQAGDSQADDPEDILLHAARKEVEALEGSPF